MGVGSSSFQHFVDVFFGGGEKVDNCGNVIVLEDFI